MLRQSLQSLRRAAPRVANRSLSTSAVRPNFMETVKRPYYISKVHGFGDGRMIPYYIAGLLAVGIPTALTLNSFLGGRAARPEIKGITSQDSNVRAASIIALSKDLTPFTFQDTKHLQAILSKVVDLVLTGGEAGVAACMVMERLFQTSMQVEVLQKLKAKKAMPAIAKAAASSLDTLRLLGAIGECATRSVRADAVDSGAMPEIFGWMTSNPNSSEALVAARTVAVFGTGFGIISPGAADFVAATRSFLAAHPNSQSAAIISKHLSSTPCDFSERVLA